MDLNQTETIPTKISIYQLFEVGNKSNTWQQRGSLPALNDRKRESPTGILAVQFLPLLLNFTQVLFLFNKIFTIFSRITCTYSCIYLSIANNLHNRSEIDREMCQYMLKSSKFEFILNIHGIILCIDDGMTTIVHY